MQWVSAEIDNEGHEQETDNGDELDGCEDELGLAINGDCEDVQADDKHDDKGDPSCDVDVVGTVPELNDSRCGRDLCTECNGAGVPVVPADSKTHGIVDVAGAELWNGAGQWQPGCHLAERHHHGEDSDAGDGVTDEEGQRTGLGQGTTDTEEETSADCSTQGDELDVTRLEAADKSVLPFHTHQACVKAYPRET